MPDLILHPVFLLDVASQIKYPAAELRGISGMRNMIYAPSPYPLPRGAREYGYPEAELRGISGMRNMIYAPSPYPLPRGAREYGYPEAELRGIY
ncbi:MAG: hypothetical protein C0392_03180 [Syntrophus sp. (in: bacteria)]|nr:hypothetical protein [Syntrophus sp. (in: bacteria)]